MLASPRTIGTKTRAIAPYRPLPWQIAPWRDKSPILLLTGGAGGGKSRVSAEKMHGYLLKYPGSTGLMLRKAREFAGKSIVPFIQHTVIGNDKRVKMHKSETAFYYQNGSMLYWGGMRDDMQREGLRSIGPDGSLDIVWMEEATQFSENDFNEVLGRMRGKAAPWRQVILSTNPDSPTHWIYKRLIQQHQAKVYYSGADDNPHNPSSYRNFLDMLTGILRSRLVDRLWVQAEGAVYETFDVSIHEIDPFEIPASWRRIRAIDFGYANPFVCQWWAVDNDGRMYLYRELYGTRRIVQDWAADIIRLSEGEEIEVTVADHDAEDRATLERYGIGTIPAQKAISPGIQAVTRRLARQEDGKPRLFVFRGALVQEDQALTERKQPTCTAAEFPAYAWPKSGDGKPVKEVPVKENDHGMDPMRYAVMYLDDNNWWSA